jgi:luciferase family oxidoreductase group 1
MPTRLSILDLAPIGRGETASDSFAASVALAQQAEALGYERMWYAEHHNMPGIASSATSVLIAHIGAHTQSIRLGAGGVMLPNHAPLTIAEQFGTLAAMYPGRIDLGLGRAPGSDQYTMHALRRDPRSAEAFPQVQDYLDGFRHHTEADELMVAHQAPTIEGRLQSVALLSEAMLNVPTS